MPSAWEMIGYTGHALAAALFAVLAILTSRRVQDRDPARQILIVALALSALWSLQHALGAVLGAGGLSAALTETVRNAAWLLYIWFAARKSGRSGPVTRRALACVLGLVLFFQSMLDILIGEGAALDNISLPFFELSWLFRCLFALGTLILLHGLFTQPNQSQNARISSWVAAALTFMWAYDCNHYALALLWQGEIGTIGPMRGFAMALLACAIAIGLRAGGVRSVRLSRTAVQRIVGGIIFALYLLAVLLLATVANGNQGPVARLVPVALLFALSVAALAILPSASLRSWLRVEITKHIFAHRYDYRVEWRRFTEAVAESHEEPRSLGERVARGVAQIVGAPSALTLLRREDDSLVSGGSWQWEGSAPVIPASLCCEMEVSGLILDLAGDDPLVRRLPEPMQEDKSLWALVPTIHNDRLVGAVLLSRPARYRRLDWEDLDMLRVVGGQAAATISDALGREALLEAQRFEEFNRRFAFILHDIKNQVSQMSLLARNAERHSDNPAFRTDMVKALKETASRMSDMLQKLTKPEAAAAGPATLLVLPAALRWLAGNWTRDHAVVKFQQDTLEDLSIFADADALHRALGQIVQNGLEASGADGHVTIRLQRENGLARIDIIDTGSGMSADFIRSSLFRPFASTKANGFGLGAQEAKSLIEAMGGSLDVTSAPGLGATFTVRFALAEVQGEAKAATPELRRSA